MGQISQEYSAVTPVEVPSRSQAAPSSTAEMAQKAARSAITWAGHPEGYCCPCLPLPHRAPEGPVSETATPDTPAHPPWGTLVVSIRLRSGGTRLRTGENYAVGHYKRCQSKKE
jgi:hypothetical protein